MWTTLVSIIAGRVGRASWANDVQDNIYALAVAMSPRPLGGSRSQSVLVAGTTSVTPRLKNVSASPDTTVWTGDACGADGALYDGVLQVQVEAFTLAAGENQYRLVLVDSTGAEHVVPEWEDAIIDSTLLTGDVAAQIRAEVRLLGEQMFGKGRIELVFETE